MSLLKWAAYDESGMAIDILFRTQVEATEQMSQNLTFHNTRIKEGAKSCLSDMYVVVISCFCSTLYFTPENIS